MHRKLTPRSTLENLKGEAKRWLKALRANDADARARLDRIWPKAPASPGLRDVQHALAMEHSLPGWTALKTQLAGSARDNGKGDETHAKLVARFLQNACPDHHVRGAPAHVIALDTADRLLRQHPEIAHDSLYTAIVCGNLAEVERILRERPEAAKQKRPGPDNDHGRSGDFEDLFADIPPKNWEPLLYLCFTRLSLPAANDNALAIANLLLDLGADPNAYFMAGDSQYTPLVGVIGEGEESRPPHPRRDELVRLLVDRGANPYDMQVTYNTHFNGDVQWYLEIAYAHALKIGDEATWTSDPNWPMFDMGGYGCGARFLIGAAIDRNKPELARWILDHGANPNAPPAPIQRRQAHDTSARMSTLTLYEAALLKGSPEIAEILASHGATRNVPTLGGREDFAAACLRLDRTEAEKLLAGHPEYLTFAKPMSFAAASDRVDVVKLLLDLGMSPDVKDSLRGDERPLHSAAFHDAIRVAKLLVDRGAQIDPRENRYSATPLWFALWGQKQRAIEFLTPLSRDVWSLAFVGAVDRLREVLAADPKLAKSRGDYETPLMWLPPDETRAVEVVEMFLAAGVDPTVRNRQGQTAADLAERRGLDDAAALLRAKEG